MGSTHGGLPSPPWTMTRDSTEGFHTTLDKEGRIDLPSPRRHETGPRHPHSNHIVAGDRSDHSSHGDHSTATGDAPAGHQPPPRAMALSSGGGMSTSPCLVTLHRVGGGTMTGSLTASPRAPTRGGKNLDDRLGPHPSLGEGRGPHHQP
jgi:hypothetical protein